MPLASNGTVYNLLALMRSVDANAPDHCQAIQIQFWENAANAKLFVGNSDMVAGRGSLAE